MNLKRNFGKEGMQNRASPRLWEWYTAEVETIGAVHIHTNTPTGKWAYQIKTYTWERNSRGTWLTKEAAYSAAIVHFTQIVRDALAELEAAQEPESEK